MTIMEMHQKVTEIFESIEGEYFYVGIRFEDKDREIGEECEWSKHNPDREDEREFPAFGSEEYDDLPDLDGTSAWDLNCLTDTKLPGYGRVTEHNRDQEAKRAFFAKHCYIIAGNRMGRHDDPDQGEILIRDAVVIAKIF